MHLQQKKQTKLQLKKKQKKQKSQQLRKRLKKKLLKKKKRVGCREAKRLEQLDNVGDTLTSEEATMFRALSARAMYLSMDRPDAMYASKELCR